MTVSGGPKGQVTKWVSLATGIWVQALAGMGNVFPHYAPTLKRVLNFNQVQLNNLGVAKDFGESVGLLAGMLCNILPTWVILLIGAIEGFLGFGTVWLVISGHIAPLAYWQMCVVLCLASNCATWLNTAVLVTSMRNFPDNRGTVVGIIKGFIGLSSAVYTQFYTTLMADDPTSLVLFLAVGPSVVCLVVMYFIRPVSTPDGAPPYYDPKEHGGFVFIHVVCISLALYLFVATLSENSIVLPPLVSKIMVAVLVAFLAAPLLVPAKFLLDKRLWKASRLRSRPSSFEALSASVNDDNLEEPLMKQSNGTHASSRRQEHTSSAARSDGYDSSRPSSPQERSKHDRAGILCMAPSNPDMDGDTDHGTLLAVGEGAVRRRPHRGEDFTLTEAMVKADFWLLFFTFFCGVGTAITATNNLGQIGLAQGYSDVTVFVSLTSVCNFLGRLGAGAVSEHYVRLSAIPRTVWMLVAEVVMIVAHLLFASALPGSLYVGSVLLGTSFGVHIAIMVPVASELFGLANFGMIYNFMTIGTPIGSLLFSGIIAGYLYDKEVAKSHDVGKTNDSSHHIAAHFLANARLGEKEADCLGAHCFQVTFLVMALVMVCGLILNIVLTLRIRRVYKSLYTNSRPGSSATLADGEQSSPRTPKPRHRDFH